MNIQKEIYKGLKPTEEEVKQLEHIADITSDGASETSQKAGQVEIIKEYMRSLQKKSAKKRLENDPNTYKKMRAMREEKKEELTISLEQ